MRIMWNSARGWGYVTHDPFAGLVLPEPEPAEQPHFSVEQAKQIIALAKPPFNIVFWLIFETGIRRGEVCALNVSHVDLTNRIIVVRNNLFLSRKGKRLHPDNFVKRQLKPILEKLGLKGALHAFRHGNATALDRMNAPMRVRQERLGHVEAQTTMGYTHLVS